MNQTIFPEAVGYLSGLWPLGVNFIARVLLIADMLILPDHLCKQHRENATGEPFESRIPLVSTARHRLMAEFYPVVMFFVIIDLEAIFIIPWAWYTQLMIFIGILLSALIGLGSIYFYFQKIWKGVQSNGNQP